MRSRSIKVEINREITKFPSFQLQFGFYSLFCKMGLPLNMARQDGSLDGQHILRRKKTLLPVFFITNDHLRLSILILAKNAFCKCFLELKSTSVFTTVKPLITNTSKEFIKCRILHFLIMECCRYLNDYMELFKTVPAYSWLFIYFRKY